METELVKQETGQPQMTVKQAIDLLKQRNEFIKAGMQEGIDFAKEEGWNKPTLLKPGAEKLTAWHGLFPRFVEIKRVEDWDNGFFSYEFKCELVNREGFIRAEANGSCNSREPKWRYKKDGSERDPFGISNTILKMAQKRSYIGATLYATATSDVFTQDIEDIEKDEGEKPKYPISEPQRKRLYAIWKKAEYEDQEIKAWLKENYGIENTKDITSDIYNEICSAIEKKEVPKLT